MLSCYHARQGTLLLARSYLYIHVRKGLRIGGQHIVRASPFSKLTLTVSIMADRNLEIGYLHNGVFN